MKRCVVRFQSDQRHGAINLDAKASASANPTVQERGQEVLYAPEQISGIVLAELREAAQQHFGPHKLVADAVITVPAYFNDDQRQVRDSSSYLSMLDRRNV